MASQWPPVKGVEFTLDFTLYKNDGTVIANPGTYTKKISKDGGAIADITASVTEEDTTYGQLSIVLSATEMNADRVWVQIKDDTTGCIPFTQVINTAAFAFETAADFVAALLATAVPGSFTAGTVGYNLGSLGFKKNTALAKFPIVMRDSTNHAPATGKTVTVTRSINGGAFGAGTLSVAELSNGVYLVDFGAWDLNGATVMLRAVASGCDDTFVSIVTSP